MLLEDLISFSDDIQCAYITISKIDEDIKPDDISRILNEKGMKDALIHVDLFPSIITDIQQENKYKEDIKRPKVILIAERRSAFFETKITDDGLKVTLIFTQAYDGKGITYEQVIQDLQSKNIKHGVKYDVIKQFLHRCIQLDSGKMASVIIAEGTPCINGQDAYFEYLIDPETQNRYVPHSDEKTGKVDILKSYRMLTVVEGEPLVRLHPEKPGKYGTNVFGDKIKPVLGKSLTLKVYDGSRLNKKDPNLLEAAIGGQPKFVNDGASVSNILEIKDVDIHSGNIDFDGSIVVLGDIKPKMHVKVTGDLEVRGVIEDAVIEVKGELFAVKGILGKQSHDMEDLSCTVRVEGDIESDFIQYAHIECTHDIRVTSYVSHSEVITDGKLIVSNDSHTKGTIMGGVICADRGIEAAYIGTQAEVETYCEVFSHYMTLCKKMVQEEQRQDTYRTTLYKLNLIKNKLQTMENVDRKERDKRLVTISHNQQSYQELLDESQNESAGLKKKLRNEEMSVCIKVYKCIYPRVRLMIGTNRLAITKERALVKYCLRQGMLKLFRHHS